MKAHTLSVSWLVMGALFVGVAVNGLLGRFQDLEQVRVTIPIALLIIGAGILAAALRAVVTKK
jgi:hypothetical protein